MATDCSKSAAARAGSGECRRGGSRRAGVLRREVHARPVYPVRFPPGRGSDPGDFRNRILSLSMVRIAGTIFAALAGLAFGSFLNVVVTRWPADESVVQPRSHCRNCGRFLAWWENIPLLSWLALKGRCRTCKAWIGWRYPLVELAVGVCWALAVWKFPGWPSISNSLAGGMANAVISLVGQLIFFWLLIALAALDAENLWLPDLITLPGIGLGFLLVLLKVVFAPASPFSAVETSMPVLMARAAFGATASIRARSRFYSAHPLDLLAHTPPRRHRTGRCEVDGDACSMAGLLPCLARLRAGRSDGSCCGAHSPAGIYGPVKKRGMGTHPTAAWDFPLYRGNYQQPLGP